MSKNTNPSGPALPGATSMHVGMMCIAGIFFASQVVRLIYNTLTGAEDLGTVQFIALVIVMSLLALMSFFFAVYMGLSIRRARRAAEEEASAPQVQEDAGPGEYAGPEEHAGPGEDADG